MVVGHQFAFNDVMNGLVDDGERYDVPLFGFGQSSIYLELNRIK